MVVTEPFIPNFALNKKGMQAGKPLEDDQQDYAICLWTNMRDNTVKLVQKMNELKIHKQYVNRPLEPWMWCTAIITATDWANFFAQRYHSKAEPSFQKIARMMWETMEKSTPTELEIGEWHLPLFSRVKDGPLVLDYCLNKFGTKQDYHERPELDRQISAARCARVSYLTHAGIRDIEEDLKLFEFLTTNNPGHWSPLEHQCTPAKFEEMSWKPNQLTTLLYGSVQEDGSQLTKGADIVPKSSNELGYCGAYRGWKPFRHEFSTEIHTTFTPPDED
jgi:hypothetical protein